MRWVTEEAFRYIDARNDVGVDVDTMFESGLFARRSDVASFLSRWKRKGYLKTKYPQSEDFNIKPKIRYHTVVDGKGHDWSTIMGLSTHGVRDFRLQMEQIEDSE